VSPGVGSACGVEPGGGERVTRGQGRGVRRSLSGVAALLAVVAACGVGLVWAAPQAPTKASIPSKIFPSPEDAVAALVGAVGKNDLKALVEILGSAGRPLVASGDAVGDERERAAFVKSYETSHSLTKDSDTMVTLQMGKDNWPFAIPLVKDGSGWRFDTKAGADELLARRIGGNELSAMQTCLAIADAQHDYWERNPEKSPILHYARRIASAKGKRDGLYWQTKDGEAESPLGPLVATAHQEGYRGKGGKPVPYHGYYYRILTSQGPAAEGGAYDYLVRGQMMGGFALVAYPAEWRVSGVMTFMINHDGQLYEKDLGPGTAELAQSIKQFNPDSSWKKVSIPAAP